MTTVLTRRPVRVGLSVGGLLVIVGCWFFVTEIIQPYSEIVLLSPLTVYENFVRVHEIVFRNLWPTLRAGLLGFLWAFAFALIVGTVMTTNQRVRTTFMPYIVGGNTVPRIAVAPLILFYIDVVEVANLVIAAWIAFFPMLINVMEGLEDVQSEEALFFSMLGASTLQRYRYLNFPNALPYIFDAMKIGMIGAMVGAIVGEFVAAQQGLGYLALLALTDGNTPLALTVVFVMGVITTVLLFVIYLIEAKLMFWEETSIFTQ